MQVLEEFKKFAVRGNVVDMAVGVIVGGAFGTIAKSLVDDLIMPRLGLVLGEVDFADLFLVAKSGAMPGPYSTLAEAKAAGAVTIDYGLFVNHVVSFLLVAFAVFLLVRAINRLHVKSDAPVGGGELSALWTAVWATCAPEAPISDEAKVERVERRGIAVEETSNGARIDGDVRAGLYAERYAAADMSEHSQGEACHEARKAIESSSAKRRVGITTQDGERFLKPWANREVNVQPADTSPDA